MEARKGIRSLSLFFVIAASAGGLACSGKQEETGQPNKATADVGASEDDFTIKREFTPSGKMIVRLSNQEVVRYGYCEGRDLIDEKADYYALQSGPGSVTRTASHPACDDKKLTPEDFWFNSEN